jgi:hypothetical protein
MRVEGRRGGGGEEEEGQVEGDEGDEEVRRRCARVVGRVCSSSADAYNHNPSC